MVFGFGKNGGKDNSLTNSKNPRQVGIGIESHVEMAAATELARNALARERFEFLMKLILVLAAVQLVSIIGMVYLASRPVKTVYIATNSAGKLTELEVLTRPLQSEQEILSWTSTVAQKAYTMNFANYQQQLDDIKPYFTDTGWTSFEAALTRSKFIETLVGQKFITSAVPGAAPVIVNDGIVAGTHGWLLEMPLIVTSSSAGVESSQELKLSITVVQRPESEHPSGLGIAQIVAN